MGDCYAQVVVGVPVDLFLVEKTTQNKVVRYNEITGEPYEKIEEEEKLFYLGEEIDDIDGDCESVFAPYDIDVFYLTDKTDVCKIIVGYEIASPSYPNYCLDVDMEIVSIKTKQLIEKLQSLGIQEKPKLYCSVEYG